MCPLGLCTQALFSLLRLPHLFNTQRSAYEMHKPEFLHNPEYNEQAEMMRQQGTT